MYAQHLGTEHYACGAKRVRQHELRCSSFLVGMGRRGQEKYAKAVNALKKIVASGLDKATDGSLLPPKVLKTLDPAFANIPPSSWRKKVSDVRSHYTLSATAIAATQGTLHTCIHD